MTIRIPGLSDALGLVAEAFGRFVDALRGYTITRSALVPRGEAVRFEHDGEVIVAMHPLDAIEHECKDDPYIWLDEALGWIYERADLQLDGLLRAADARVRLGNLRQKERLAAWLVENDMTEYDLRAATMRTRWLEAIRTRDPEHREVARVAPERILLGAEA